MSNIKSFINRRHKQFNQHLSLYRMNKEKITNTKYKTSLHLLNLNFEREFRFSNGARVARLRTFSGGLAIGFRRRLRSRDEDDEVCVIDADWFGHRFNL